MCEFFAIICLDDFRSIAKENNIQFDKDENGKQIAMVKFEKNTISSQKTNYNENEDKSNEEAKNDKSKKEKSKSQQYIPIEVFYDSFNKNYPSFFPLVKPLLGIRPKKITLYDSGPSIHF